MYAFYCRLNVHIYDSPRTVIRAIRRKIADKPARDPALRETRKELYRRVLQEHNKSRALALQFRL